MGETVILSKCMKTFHKVINKENNSRMLLYQSLVKYYVWGDIYQHERYPSISKTRSYPWRQLLSQHELNTWN